jgi:predicted CopG family antitoxin
VEGMVMANGKTIKIHEETYDALIDLGFALKKRTLNDIIVELISIQKRSLYDVKY